MQVLAASIWYGRLKGTGADVGIIFVPGSLIEQVFIASTFRFICPKAVTLRVLAASAGCDAGSTQ